MATNYTTPNMGLTIPIPTQEPGPNFAYDVNASMTVLDGHNHAAGSGVQIQPSGLNINGTLNIQNNILNNIQAATFQVQTSNAGSFSLFFKGVDLYATDGGSNVIRITQSGSVAGSSGTITGLPSGTASASFSGSTFTFQSATSTAANIDGGNFFFRNLSPNSTYAVELSAPNALGSNYQLFLPAIPVSTQVMSLNTAGNMGSIPTTGSGNAVLSAAPTLSGSVYINGILGVGNSSPTTKIDLAPANVQNQVDYVRLQPVNAGQGLTYGGGLLWQPNFSGYTKTSAGIFQTSEGSFFRSGLSFFTNNVADTSTAASEVMRIFGTGDVYVGLSPSDSYAKFVVSGSKSYVGKNIVGAFFNSASAEAVINLQDQNSSAGVGIGVITNDLVFYNNSAASLAETARITSAGRLGIGTSSPSAALSVGASSQFTVDTSGNTTTSGYSHFASTDSTTANVVGAAMTSTGANAVAATMTSTGANAIAGTISNNTIAAAKLVNSSITATQLSSSINLPGAPTLGSGTKGLVSNHASSSGLSILYGAFSPAGTPTLGAGFSVSRSSTGVYVLTFTAAFGGAPIVTANGYGLSDVVINLGSVTASSITIFAYVGTGAPIDTDVMFTVVGPI